MVFLRFSEEESDLQIFINRADTSFLKGTLNIQYSIYLFLDTFTFKDIFVYESLTTPKFIIKIIHF